MGGLRGQVAQRGSRKEGRAAESLLPEPTDLLGGRRDLAGSRAPQEPRGDAAWMPRPRRGSDAGKGLDVRRAGIRLESREGEAGGGAHDLSLVGGRGEREPRHPEKRTPEPFVHQTPATQLPEGHGVSPRAELTSCASAGKERAERRQEGRERD